MSRIDELIAAHCPDGVEHVPLKEVCEDFLVPMRDRPRVFDGDIPWCRIEDIEGTNLNGSLSGLGVSEKIVREMNLKVVPAGTVIAACSASLGTYAIASRPLITNQTFIGLVCGPRLYNRYLLHLMFTMTGVLKTASTTGTIAYVSRRKFEELVIPVPPLPVQEEIVRILDTFSALEAGLEAELEARKQQYEHYRDSLLAYPANTQRESLGAIGTIFGGLTGKSKADFVDGNAKFASYRNVFNNISLEIDVQDFVYVARGENQRSLAYGDVIFTGSSESSAEVGMTSVVTTKLEEPFYLNSFCIGFRPENLERLHPDFAKHLFRSRRMRDQIIQTASGVTRFNISKARLSKIEVPLPPRDNQLKTAEILDHFDALVNDLSIGLPAELAARRKQYEYYRDKLLTFKELPA